MHIAQPELHPLVGFGQASPALRRIATPLVSFHSAWLHFGSVKFTIAEKYWSHYRRDRKEPKSRNCEILKQRNRRPLCSYRWRGRSWRQARIWDRGFWGACFPKMGPALNPVPAPCRGTTCYVHVTSRLASCQVHKAWAVGEDVVIRYR